jgi:hypothetical protein
LVALLALGVPFITFAQEMEAPLTVETQPVPGLQTQNVSVHHAQLLGQERGAFSVSFILENLENRTQSGITYDVTLMSGSNSGAQFVGTEVLSLAPNETMEKVVSYPLRNVPLGEYLVSVTAKTTAGEQLGQSVAGTLLMTPELAASAYETTAAAGEEMVEATPATPAERQNIHFVITVLALAVTLLVVVLAAGRHKKVVTSA